MEGEKGPQTVAYTIKDDVVYSIDIEEYSNGKWVPYNGKDVQMEFRLDKCVVMHIEKGVVVDSPLISNIPSLDVEDSYKYLGITEASNILYDENKTKSTKEFICCTIAILTPILRYSFGVLN